MTSEAFIEKLSITLGLTADKRLTINTSLSDVWDSLGQIAVLSMLDSEFKFSLEMEELNSIKTVKDIINILKSRKVIFE